MTQFFCALTLPPPCTNEFYEDEFESKRVIFYSECRHSQTGYKTHIGRFTYVLNDKNVPVGHGWLADADEKYNAIVKNVKYWMHIPEISLLEINYGN